MARTYDNSARQQRSRETRRRIIATAGDLLLDGGYGAMTIASLAAAADVSSQTVYNTVGRKPDIVKAVYDVLLAGDDEPVPMSQRPGFLAIAEAEDRAAFVAAYATWVRVIYDRVGALLGALLRHGPGTDLALAAFMDTIEGERRVGATAAMTMLRDRHGVPDRYTEASEVERLVDSVWVLIAPDVHDRLVRRRGWSPDAYEGWIAAQLGFLVLD